MMIFERTKLPFFGESSQTHKGSFTEFPEFLRESVRFDFRIEICARVQFVKIDGAFVQPLIKKQTRQYF
jgi:hypothetical protein